MTYEYPTEYEVIVVGGGHAGCEAALAAARMGCRTLLLTINADAIGLMSCNPAIGGLAKGHLVREIDALGGEMAKTIDATGIQFRQLNTSKGPAVRSSRAQADKQLYRLRMKQVLESVYGLDVKQAMVDAVLTEGGKSVGVETNLGVRYRGKTVILCPGTFLKGLVHIGLVHFPAGRAGDFPAMKLSDSLRSLGFSVGRLKTGTTPRVDGKTIDFSRTVRQEGDSEPVPFSFGNRKITRPQVSCYMTYTNAATHEAIRSGLSRSPLYSGVIRGIGPRYCPSIEDKVVRFSDKERHQVFLEPEGLRTAEYYPNGVSTSLPYDIQVKMLRTIPGLEQVEIVRPGYAIEYDFVDPVQLYPSLETKIVENLFHAGQINGTSGYEEAAAQGIAAGMNAARKVRGEPPVVFGRAEAYIGVLIDDLVTKGAPEPYRMFTSRAEYRLLLREDNADLRLSETGHRVGLLPEERYREFLRKRDGLSGFLRRLEETRVTPGHPICRLAEEGGGGPVRTGITYAELLRRPEVSVAMLLSCDGDLAGAEPGVALQAELTVKYEGYIRRQEEEAKKLSKYEEMRFPSGFPFESVYGLSAEVRDKLVRVRPASIGQARRIPGVTPAAVALLLVALKRNKGASRPSSPE
ncbi:MAG: tRNA uridine-5-carboxymethylaminomethyl(34) synthesis enzyme MnmG [Deltaproteobacteria bacterium RBG_16_64_85]|nr:MAG: tRNA uridine-5-carboxymethylaminomethyl(34) synthesis enzyme MnmG [Deltaproteobacteria bacterium RBG_16_64_85]